MRTPDPLVDLLLEAGAPAGCWQGEIRDPTTRPGDGGVILPWGRGHSAGSGDGFCILDTTGHDCGNGWADELGGDGGVTEGLGGDGRAWNDGDGIAGPGGDGGVGACPDSTREELDGDGRSQRDGGGFAGPEDGISWRPD